MCDNTMHLVFPTPGVSGYPIITLRDWFAWGALTSILANGVYDFAGVATDAYRFADAMIAERSKNTDKGQSEVMDDNTGTEAIDG